MKKLHPVLGSSADASKLALSWKGALLALIPILIIIGKQFNVALEASEITELIESVFSVISVSMIFLGLLRKVYYKVKYGRQL